jgi:hypothetical protein
MNSLSWTGIILWGLLLTGFGLASVPPEAHTPAADVAAQDVIFLIVGGLLTTLIGVMGLTGFMGGVTKLRNEQKNAL